MITEVRPALLLSNKVNNAQFSIAEYRHSFSILAVTLKGVVQTLFTRLTRNSVIEDHDVNRESSCSGLLSYPK